MTEFATLDDDRAAHRVLVWREEGGRCHVVSRHDSVDDLPEGIPTWRFDVPTTASAGSACNGGRHPVLDADGAPLWQGARIAFCVPSHYVNTVVGTGTYGGADLYGGSNFVSDRPLKVYGRGGAIEAVRREAYTTVSTFAEAGDLTGYRLLAGRLGDRFEHGTTGTFIRLAEDPRDVCAPVPAAGPARRR